MILTRDCGRKELTKEEETRVDCDLKPQGQDGKKIACHARGAQGSPPKRERDSDGCQCVSVGTKKQTKRTRLGHSQKDKIPRRRHARDGCRKE